MKTQDNNVRFNIIDALIIIFVLVLIALTVYVFVLGNDLADLYSQKESIVYTVCVTDINLDGVMVGDTVYHWNKDSDKGKITEIRFEEDEQSNPCTYITVSVVARKIKESYYLSGNRIEENGAISISFSRFDTSNSAKCVLIEKN